MTRCNFNFPASAVSVVTPPSEPVLTLAEAYQQLRLDPEFGTSPPSRPDDVYIEEAVVAATAELDGPEGWLGRCLAPQTLALTLPEFPSGEPVYLPFPPLISVDSVTYLDSDGADQTLTETTDFRIGREGRVAYIAAAYGKAWPVGRVQGGAVTILYRAGYQAGSPPVVAVPALIKQYLKARLGFYYEHREPVVTGTIATPIPGYAHVLENLRIRGVYKS